MARAENSALANVFPYINHSHHARMRPLALSSAGLLTCAWDQCGLRRISCLLGFPMTGFRQRISVSALTAAGRWGFSPLFLSAEHEHSLLASADSKDKKLFTCYVSHDTPFSTKVQSHFCITNLRAGDGAYRVPAMRKVTRTPPLPRASAQPLRSSIFPRRV